VQLLARLPNLIHERAKATLRKVRPKRG